MKTHKTVALLPMKQNSERIKSKNFKEFAGKPLFLWMLETLLSVPSIEKIVINTDATETLKNNKILPTDRIIIRERKDHLLGDDISMNLIIKDDIDFIDSNNYLMTHTTNPLLSSSTISNSLKIFENQKSHDSLFSVNKFQSRFYDSEKKPVNHDPTNLLKTQDLPLWFEENSCLYIFSKKSFDKTNSRIGAHPYLFTLPKYESIDIDDSEDWEIAESLMLGRNNTLK